VRFTTVFVFTVLQVSLAMAAPNLESFDMRVTRVRSGRGQTGTLHIDTKGLRFTSLDSKTAVTITMLDLREADVADPRALHFATYEHRKWMPTERLHYLFRAEPDAPVEALAQFLTSHMQRPVVGHFAEKFQCQVAAYHRRALGGTSGRLAIGEDTIQFMSEKPADSRTWTYQDIDTIGKPDRFRFRITTDRETYVLELKENLPEAAYDLAWSKIYQLPRSANE
jgi:hypothetical protein